jgi:O-antigen/teichoic acid export membrane protein
MASFGVLLMLAGLFSQVYLTAGPLVLGHFVLVSALPFFTVPFGIFQRLYRLASGVSSALFPVVAELDGVKDHGTLDRVFMSGTRVLLLAGLASGLPAVLLAGPFLTLWMGEAFAVEATPVLERLFLAYAITLATVPSVEMARGRGQAARVATHVGILASVNLLGVLLLAPGNGVAGAASAFLTAQAVGSAVLFLWIGGRSVFRLLNFRLVTLLTAGLLLTYACHVSAQETPIRILAALGIGLFLTLIGYFWALAVEERQAMRSSFMGVFGRA